MTDRSRPLLAAQALIASLLILIGLGTASAAAEKRIQFNIVAQDLASALNEFARQSAQELLFSTDLAASKRTSGVVGQFAPTDALKALLQGTGLRYRINNDNTILIEKGDLESARRNEIQSSPFMTPMMGSQAMPTFRAAQDAEGGTQETAAQSGTDERSPGLGTMTVTTGSHIPGAETGSPVLVFDRVAIEQTGAATAQQFLSTLVQNHGGGRSDEALEGPTANDEVFGAAANLRGLGAGTTLVLLNGRRLALSGNLEYVDISMIPLSAVERIEVLTDGASAMYGADAIGGVVNFVLRKDYTGAETRVLGSWTSGGGGQEKQVSQTLGAGWSSGSALLALEYYDRDKISAFQREEMEELGRDNSIIPEQEKQSVLISVTQELGASVRLMADAQFSKRSSLGEIFNDELAEIPNTSDSDNEVYGGSLGLGYSFADGWDAELVGGLNHVLSDVFFTSPFDLDSDNHVVRESEIRSLDATVTGDLFNLPAGPLKLALGGGYREESTGGQSILTTLGTTRLLTNDDFDLKAAFAELQVPVIKDDLTLSLAGRYEEYSNFGSSFNPKFGLLYSPIEALQLRGTWGTSFKAPTMSQMDTASAGSISAANVVTSSGTIRILRMGGNNPALDAETATTWTAGLDFNLGGFSAHATYFSIEYEKRIESIVAPQTLQLTDAAFVGTRVLRADVTDEEFNAMAAALLANPDRLNFVSCRGRAPNRNPCDELPTAFSAILDRRLRNLATTEDTGVDLFINQIFNTAVGTFDLGLNATYLFDYTRQFTEAAPSVDLIDTVFLPVDFRARANFGFRRNAWTIVTYVNHTASYTDNAVEPFAEIDSWTTLDLNFRYDTGKVSDGGWLDDVAVVLNVSNLFDKRPPHIEREFTLTYDMSNADPYGRTMSLSFQKSW